MPEGEYKPTRTDLNGDSTTTIPEANTYGKHSAEGAAEKTQVLPTLQDEVAPVTESTPAQENPIGEQPGIDDKTVEMQQPNIPQPDTTAQTGIQDAIVIGTAPMTAHEGDVVSASTINTAAPTEELPKLDGQGGKHKRQHPIARLISSLTGMFNREPKPTDAVLKVDNTADVRQSVTSGQSEPVDAVIKNEPVGANK
jgi:hypothetical protein